jgi:hypothetical protein
MPDQVRHDGNGQSLLQSPFIFGRRVVFFFVFFEKRRRPRVRTMIQIKSRKINKNMRMSKAMITLDMLPLS